MLNLISTIASIMGLAVSIWTLLVATGARKAANEARQEIRKGNAAEEFKDLATLAAEFLSHVEANEVSAALVRARDLMSGMYLASRRWTQFLSVESRNNFEVAYGQVSVISRSLSASGAPDTPQQKDKLLRFCHGVVGSISKEAGLVLSQLERSEEPDA